jgi:hypothetical protein
MKRYSKADLELHSKFLEQQPFEELVVIYFSEKYLQSPSKNYRAVQ